MVSGYSTMASGNATPRELASLDVWKTNHQHLRDLYFQAVCTSLFERQYVLGPALYATQIRHAAKLKYQPVEKYVLTFIRKILKNG